MHLCKLTGGPEAEKRGSFLRTWTSFLIVLMFHPIQLEEKPERNFKNHIQKLLILD